MQIVGMSCECVGSGMCSSKISSRGWRWLLVNRAGAFQLPYRLEQSPRPLLVLGGPKIGPYLS